MSPVTDFLSNSTNRRNLIILIALLIGLPIAFYLAQQTQTFKSHAADEPIIITGPNVSTNQDGKQVIKPARTDANGKPVYQVDLLLTAPTVSGQ